MKKFDPNKIYFISGVMSPFGSPQTDRDGAQIGYMGVGAENIPRSLLSKLPNVVDVESIRTKEFVLECIKHSEYVEFKEVKNEIKRRD